MSTKRVSSINFSCKALLTNTCWLCSTPVSRWLTGSTPWSRQLVPIVTAIMHSFSNIVGTHRDRAIARMVKFRAQYCKCVYVKQKKRLIAFTKKTKAIVTHNCKWVLFQTNFHQRGRYEWIILSIWIHCCRCKLHCLQHHEWSQTHVQSLDNSSTYMTLLEIQWY